MKVYRCRICGEVYIGTQKPGSCPFCGAHENYLKEFFKALMEIESDHIRLTEQGI